MNTETTQSNMASPLPALELEYAKATERLAVRPVLLLVAILPLADIARDGLLALYLLGSLLPVGVFGGGWANSYIRYELLTIAFTPIRLVCGVLLVISAVRGRKLARIGRTDVLCLVLACVDLGIGCVSTITMVTRIGTMPPMTAAYYVAQNACYTLGSVALPAVAFVILRRLKRDTGDAI